MVGDIVISIDTEFVENEEENIEKQDCEIKAFYRIKEQYPKLPIIISGDALYACEPVITTCVDNKWEYILRLKDGRLKLLVEEIEGLEKAEIEEKNIRYWNEVKYGEVQREKRANVLKFYENKKDKVTEFMWITSILITEKKQRNAGLFWKAKMENRE